MTAEDCMNRTPSEGLPSSWLQVPGGRGVGDRLGKQRGDHPEGGRLSAEQRAASLFQGEGHFFKPKT